MVAHAAVPAPEMLRHEGEWELEAGRLSLPREEGRPASTVSKAAFREHFL